MLGKPALLAAVGAAVWTLSSPLPASAKTCLAQTETGIGHYVWTWGVARASARRAWRAWAQIHHGNRYDSWTLAEDKSYSCGDRADRRKRCIATARPCRL